MFNKTHAFDLAMVFFFVFFFFRWFNLNLSVSTHFSCTIFLFIHSLTHCHANTYTRLLFIFNYRSVVLLSKINTQPNRHFPFDSSFVSFFIYGRCKAKAKLTIYKQSEKKKYVEKKLNRTLAKNDENFLFSYFNLSPCLTLFSFHLFLTSFLALLFVSINCFNGSN